MIGRSDFLRLLRREALPLAVVAMLALFLQGLIAPMVAAATSVGGPNPFDLCLTLDAAADEPAPSGDPGGHGHDACPCGPVCPHASACVNARGLAPASPWALDADPASAPGLRAHLEARPDRAAFLRARGIRGPPSM
ncbi:hypothetical protein [Stappia sp.]|uniref:hypothetical protein n=1 Tax=Stappia sp. TaxID=1870903 RepID=UPI0032D8DA87